MADDLPTPFSDGSQGSGYDFWNGLDKNQLAGGLTSLFGGLFGDSSSPWQDAMDQYQKWADKAQGSLQPYSDAGSGAIPQFQDWLKKQQDPSGFINNLMGQYQESPYAKYMQQQSMRAGQNAASASGLMGSTPLTQQMQQNAANISSQDMQNWLGNALGINTQYGQGLNNMMGMGANSANALANMFGQFGRGMGDLSYNKGAAGQNDMWNMIAGIAQLASL